MAIVALSWGWAEAELIKVEKLTKIEQEQLQEVQKTIAIATKKMNDLKKEIMTNHSMVPQYHMEWSTEVVFDGNFILIYYRNHMPESEILSYESNENGNITLPPAGADLESRIKALEIHPEKLIMTLAIVGMTLGVAGAKMDIQKWGEIREKVKEKTDSELAKEVYNLTHFTDEEIKAIISLLF